MEPIKSVDDYLQLCESLQPNEHTYRFRGQSNSAWPVCSSWARAFEDQTYSDCLSYHSDLIRDFHSFDSLPGYIRDLSRESPSLLTDWDKVAIVQHYGGETGKKTILTDFTIRPLIALWFACREKEHWKEDGKVFVVSIDILDEVGLPHIHDYILGNYSDLYTLDRSRLFPANPQYSPRDNAGHPYMGKYVSRIDKQSASFVLGIDRIEKADCKSAIIEADSKKRILDELRYFFSISEKALMDDWYALGEDVANGKVVSTDGFTDAEYSNLAKDISLLHRQPRAALPYYEKALQYWHSHREEMVKAKYDGTPYASQAGAHYYMNTAWALCCLEDADEEETQRACGYARKGFDMAQYDQQRPGFAVVYAHSLLKLDREKDAYDLCKDELDSYKSSAPTFFVGKNSTFIDELRRIVNIYESHHSSSLID